MGLVILDIHGWRKEERIELTNANLREGCVDICIYRPLSLLVNEEEIPVSGDGGTTVRLFYFGEEDGIKPIFEMR